MSPTLWTPPKLSATFTGTSNTSGPSDPCQREPGPQWPLLCGPDMEVKDERFPKREEVLSEHRLCAADFLSTEMWQFRGARHTLSRQQARKLPRYQRSQQTDWGWGGGATTGIRGRKRSLLETIGLATFDLDSSFWSFRVQILFSGVLWWDVSTTVSDLRSI